MSPSVWSVVDATHADAWTPAHRQQSAAVARESYARMLHDLGRWADAFGPESRRWVAVLEQGRPWWEAHTNAVTAEHRLELPFDRGTGPVFLLGLLNCLPRSPGGFIAFISGRHGWPAALHDEAIDASFGRRAAPEVHVYGPAGRDWREGAMGAFGPMEVFLEAFRLVQPALVQSFLRSLRRTEGRQGELIEELYPYLPEVDLFRDVLAPAVELAPRFAARVEHRELSAA
jgi:hypothetical protein